MIAEASRAELRGEGRLKVGQKYGVREETVQ